MMKMKKWFDGLIQLFFVAVFAINGFAAGPNINETFMNSDAPEWTLKGTAVLTSGGADPTGEGWLRLTSATKYQAGSAIYNKAFASSYGVQVTFQYATYGGDGADGFSFYLIDGSTESPTIGATGAGLGYSKDRANGSPGVTNGYLGIGFDEFGNFSSTTTGDCSYITCPGGTSNSVVIRGSGSLNGPGFNFYKSASLAIPTGDRAGAKKVRITITPAPSVNITVEVDSGAGFVKLIDNFEISGISGQATIPATFKMGISASTGGMTNYHEIRGFSVGGVLTNAIPTATADITGDACLTGQLTGSYSNYHDEDGDLEDTDSTKFQWYTGTDLNCSGKQAITGSISTTYTPKDADKGKYICFGVTPVAETGTLIGAENIAVTKAAVATPAYSSDPAVSAAIDFGTIAAPANAAKTLTVTNAGTGTLSVTDISLSDTTHFSVSPNTADIACSANKAFTITCNGTEKGTFTATMAVAHNAAGSPANYNLTCNVTTAPLYTSSLNGTLSMTSCTPADATATLTVTNTGTDVLNITAVTLGGTDAAKFAVSPTAVPITVAVGRSQVFTITGNGSTVGSFTGTLELKHDAAGSPAQYTLSSVISDCYVPTYDPGYTYVPPANQPPVADKLYVSTEENKPISVKLTGSDADAHWFLLLLKPLKYTVLTQPLHGTLSGTAPDLIYTPEPGFVGTDSFTFRVSDGTSDSAATAVSLIVHQNSHAYADGNYALTFFCVEYDGVRYGFRMNYTPLTSDPSGLYWKMDIPTFGKAYSDAKGCISVGDDLKLGIPSAYFQGTTYEFTLNYNPISGDPSGLYWKMDLGTFKAH